MNQEKEDFIVRSDGAKKEWRKNISQKEKKDEKEIRKTRIYNK